MISLHAVLFDSRPPSKIYGRMAKVWQLTAAEHASITPATLHRVTSEDRELNVVAARRRKPCPKRFIDNARKTKYHCELVSNAADGDMLILTDVDMMFVDEMAPLFNSGMDLICTVRPEGAKYPLNTGVVGVRVSDRTRGFYGLWLANAINLLGDANEDRTARYGGINQAAFVKTLQENPSLIEAAEVPCDVWNCEYETHSSYGPQTRAIHIIGNLRRSIFGSERPQSSQVAELRRRWLAYYAQTEAAVA